MMMEQIANRYEILSLIGQGGMADVYKAKGYNFEIVLSQSKFYVIN